MFRGSFPKGRDYRGHYFRRKQGFKIISGMLYDGDWYDDADVPGPMQAFAWPMLLQGGGLATLHGTNLKLTRSGTAALRKDLAGGIKGIWHRWETKGLIDEFSRVTAIKGQQSAKGRTMAAPSNRRPLINEALYALDPGKWVSVDEFARFMISRGLSFPMVNYEWKLYFSEPTYGHLDYHDTWSLLQLRYLLVYLFEYCATAGIVDVAYTRPEHVRPEYLSCWGADDLPYLSHCDGLMYIRLNVLGAFVLGITDQFGAPEDSETFAIQGTTLHYTGSETIAADRSFFLDKVADRINANQWRISISSLLKALKANERLKDIETFLDAIATSALSPEIQNLLAVASLKTTRMVDVGQARLIECDAEWRKKILIHKKLSTLCLPAGNIHIVVLPGKEKLFFKEAEALGLIVGRND